MPKARVYELAKELGVDSKTVLEKLKDMGEFVKSASSTVETPVARRLKEAFPKANADSAAAPAARNNAPQPSRSPRSLRPPQPMHQRLRPSLRPPSRPGHAPRRPSPANVPAHAATPSPKRHVAVSALLRPARTAALAPVRRTPTATSVRTHVPTRRRRAPAHPAAPKATASRAAAPSRAHRSSMRHARATTRSAASRACIRPRRVTFRARIRWRARP